MAAQELRRALGTFIESAPSGLRITPRLRFGARGRAISARGTIGKRLPDSYARLQAPARIFTDRAAHCDFDHPDPGRDCGSKRAQTAYARPRAGGDPGNYDHP